MNRIAILRSFIEKNPADMFSQHALSMELLKLGEYQEARKLMEEILEFDEMYIGTYYHLGKLYERIGEFMMAEVVYTKGAIIAEKLKTQIP